MANHRPLPSRSRHANLHGSRMTNDTSANISPSLNDNNSRTVLLSSDDILTPQHRQHHYSRSSRQRPAQIHTDSTADYDEVVSHSTVQDTTPQTSSESTSMSEAPSESRFKTFVKQKKNKGTSDQSNRNVTESSRLAVEADVQATSRLITNHYDEEKLASPLARPSNGGGQRNVHYISGSDPVHVKPLPDEPAESTVDEDEESQHAEDEERSDDGDENEEEEDGEDDDDDEEEDEEEEEEDDDDAEEGVYELSGGNVTGTGSRQKKTENQLSNSRPYHQSSSSQDSNGNLISTNHKQQSRPLSDQARSQLTTDSGTNHNNGDSGTAGSKADLPNKNNHSRSRSNESAPENWRKGNDL